MRLRCLTSGRFRVLALSFHDRGGSGVRFLARPLGEKGDDAGYQAVPERPLGRNFGPVLTLYLRDDSAFQNAGP